MPRGMNKKASNEAVVDAYRKTRNVNKAAVLLGMSGASVAARLRRLGVAMRYPRWTEEETSRLLADYVQYRDDGRIDELAVSMGRPTRTIEQRAGKLGLRDRRAPKRYLRTWKGMDVGKALLLFEQFKRSRRTLTQFCAKQGTNYKTFSLAMREHFPDEWETVIEAKAPRSTWYYQGRAFEYRTRDLLRGLGFFVTRSPRSSSPSDLVAIRTGQVLLVQCKRDGRLAVNEWNTLFDLAASIGATPVLAGTPTATAIEFWRLTGRKSGRVEKQPREPLELT